MRRWEEVEELMWSFFSVLEGGLLVMSQTSARTLRPLLLYRHWWGDHRGTGTTARKMIWKHSSVTSIIPECGAASRPPWCPSTGASPRRLEENNKQVGGLPLGVACAPRNREGFLPFPPTWLKAWAYGCVSCESLPIFQGVSQFSQPRWPWWGRYFVASCNGGCTELYLKVGDGWLES